MESYTAVSCSFRMETIGIAVTDGQRLRAGVQLTSSGLCALVVVAQGRAKVQLTIAIATLRRFSLLYDTISKVRARLSVRLSVQ